MRSSGVISCPAAAVARVRSSASTGLVLAQEGRDFEHVVRNVEARLRRRRLALLLLVRGEDGGLLPPLAVPAEARRDDRDAHLIAERVVDDRAEDDIRVLVG